jgi:bifunctional DNA-binding transcriptional regulator/antitoxin component of YhaV-PrlF toxin-antitoxin module
MVAEPTSHEPHFLLFNIVSIILFYNNILYNNALRCALGLNRKDHVTVIGRAFRTRPFILYNNILYNNALRCALGLNRKDHVTVIDRAFRTRPFRRTRTQTEFRNSDLDFRNRDFPTP